MKDMTHFFNKVLWIKMLGLVLLLCIIYYGVKKVDMVTDRLMTSHGLMKEGATKITKKHFSQPEESVLNVENLNKFLDNATKYKAGILGWKPFYVALLLTYLVLACLIIFIVGTDKEDSEYRT